MGADVYPVSTYNMYLVYPNFSNVKILLVVTENKECPFLTSPNECKKRLFKKTYFRAVYHENQARIRNQLLEHGGIKGGVLVQVINQTAG